MGKLFRAGIFVLGCMAAVVLLFAAAAYTYSFYLANYDYRLDGWPEKSAFGEPVAWKTEFPGKLRILAIQGGALHGLADLEILKALEERSGKPVYELFDFVAGASTGAIITALLLNPDDSTGKPVSAEEAIAIYERFAKQILDSPLHHRLLTGYGLLGPLLLNRGRVDAAESVFDDDRFNELLRPAMFPSFSQKTGDLHLFRNWQAGDANLYLKTLVTAVTSVPAVFPAVVFVGGESQGGFYGDPALILNAPGDLAYLHARSNLPDVSEVVVVALGTVRDLQITDETGIEGGIVRWFDPVFRMISRGEKTVSLYALEQHDRFDTSVSIATFAFESSVPADSSGFDPSEEAIAVIRQAGQDFVADNGKDLDKLIHELTTDAGLQHGSTVPD